MALATQIISILTFLLVLYLVFRMRNVQRELMRRISSLESLHRARMGMTTQARASQARPPIDSRARTTRRDTPDIPPTGRMSTGVHRVRSDRSGPTDDSGLLENT